MALPAVDQRRLLLDAALLVRFGELVGELRAAGTEPAAGRRVDRAGHVPGEHDPLARPFLLRGSGSGIAEISAWVYGCGGGGEQLLHRRGLDDLAQVHHRHPVGDVPHHRQVVRDEQVGQPQLFLELLQQVDHAGLDGDVQRRDRLVQHQHLRLERQRPGDADALPLPAGELVRVPVAVLRIEPHLLQQLAHLLPAAVGDTGRGSRSGSAMISLTRSSAGPARRTGPGTRSAVPGAAAASPSGPAP